MTQGPARADVLIAGGSFPGLALAAVLKQALGDRFAVAVVDPAFDDAGRAQRQRDPRASAIVTAARRLLDTTGVWNAVAARAQPILDMAITDSRLTDAVRPMLLRFDGEIAPGEPFAHMVENRDLIVALEARAQELGVTMLADTVAGLAAGPASSTVALASGASVKARLVVAADGARSRVRDLADVDSVTWDYRQAGIVTTVSHERDHEGRATEHFLPAGPFAMLPLTGRRSSIVWTEEAREAERFVALPDAEFLAELERRFGLQLGDLALAGPRRAFPLGFAMARSFVAKRVALVGDAAHVIHPIAGQGLNVALRDVAALAETIADADRLGLDPGAPEALDAYQRWRRFDAQGMGLATDALNRLFSNRSGVLRAAGDPGLGAVERLPALKALFIREAAGLVGDVPRLLRGEPL
ncbi:MAG: ubiquinone biosynthesis hydroxylase [Rhizobiales bacterium]|nr:ubiquinone biosynthesis hydroxylase [Hyphomicrobiales bacterium]